MPTWDASATGSGITCYATVLFVFLTVTPFSVLVFACSLPPRSCLHGMGLEVKLEPVTGPHSRPPLAYRKSQQPPESWDWAWAWA